MLEIRLCGGVEVVVDGRVLPEAMLAGRQGRLVLAYLACERQRAVPREELADLLWPDRLPSSWTTSLSAVISRLRRMFAEAGLDASTTLASPSGAYRLLLPADATVDWEQAQRAVEEAEAGIGAGDGDRALKNASAAALIVERGFLSDDCRWVDGQREVARDLFVRAGVARSEAYILLGSPARAIDAAREALATDDTREAAFRVLMRGHAAAGERAEALRVWERCRAILVDELGVDPSPETEAVYLEILNGPAEPWAPAATTTTALPSGVVTFLLTDIVESSALWESHPAAMATALERHDALVSDVVTRGGGLLLKSKLEGDATVSAFTRATAGAAAALALRDALQSQAWPEGAVPKVRMALHTGEAYERNGDYFGPALNRAARLRSLADGDQILLSQAVAELVRDHLPDDVVLVDRGHRDLRGLSRGENVYELVPGDGTAVAADPRPALVVPDLPHALASAGPFVGRVDDLAVLMKEWEHTLAGSARALLVGGEPGVGKSRLAAEHARRARADGTLVLYGRCDEELGVPYQPFIDAVRSAAPALGRRRLRDVRGVDELIRVVPEIGQLVPDAAAATRADPETERYALFGAVTQLLVAAAAEVPVLLVLDDLHWAGKTTLTLLRHVLRDAGPARLMVVGTYRDTELSRTHPLAATIADLRADGVAHRLSITGLPVEDVVSYLKAVGNDDRALGRELAKVTAGNPFFLIEALRHLQETGGTWTPGSLPEGVREATGRRLSRLPESASAALSIAAVVGTTFAIDIVEAVYGADLIDEFDEACRAGLLVEEPGSPGRFRFAHAIVRQVLLTELATVRRVRMHHTIAELLEARAGDTDAYLADLAHHWFECASSGSADKAVAACTRAAEHAIERLAYEEAGDLFGMALAALESTDVADDDTVARLHLARCNALLAAGEVIAARSAVDALGRVKQGSPRLGAWHTTFAGELAVLSEPERLVEVVDGVGAAAETMREVDDLVGAAKARYVHALALERLGRIGEAERALDAALAAARAAEDRSLADAVLAEVPLAVLWGPSPVTRASGRCLDVVRVCRITAGASAVEAVALRCQAQLEALRGRTEAARRMIGSARRTADKLGLAHQRLETDVAAGLVELLAREPVSAEKVLRPAWDELRERRLGGEAARAGGLLARALLTQHRYDEAEAVAAEAELLAGADLRAGILWRGVRGEAAARRGEHDLALELARAAVDMAAATDALLPLVDARLALAAVLRIAGRHDEADAESRRALEVCEAKGATVLAELARATAPIGETDASEGGRPAVDDHDDISLRDPRYANDAVRWLAQTSAALNSGDATALAAWMVPGFQIDDRRKFVGNPQDAGATAGLLAAGGGHVSSEVLATRGARLVLVHVDWTREGALVELLLLGRYNADGLADASIWFDVDDLDAALVELDRLFVDGEGAQHARILEQRLRFMDAMNRGDWTVTRSFLSDGWTLTDHRATGFPAMTLAELEQNRDTIRLSGIDRQQQVEHVLAVSDHALLTVDVEVGRVDSHGGEFAAPFVSVIPHDGELALGLEIFGEDQLDEARVRFDELSNVAPDADARWENQALRTGLRMTDAFNAGDMQTFAAGASADCAHVDHRRLVGLRTEVDAASAVPAVTAYGGQISGGLIATRGDRLALSGVQWGTDEAELVMLVLFRCNDEPLLDRIEWFDDDDIAAAYAQLDALYEVSAGEVHHRLAAAFSRRDWEALGAVFDPDVVQADYRPARLGEIRGRDSLVEAQRVVIDLAPDSQYRVHHERRNGRYGVAVMALMGSQDGGAFENNVISVVTCDDDRIVRREVFDQEQAAEAYALYDELVAAAGPAPFANKVIQAVDEVAAAWNLGDWDGVVRGFGGEAAIKDDRRFAQLGEVSALKELRKIWDSTQTTMHRDPRFFTRGDGLALYLLTYHVLSGHSGPSDMPILGLVEYTADGELVPGAMFDGDDVERGYAELNARYLASLADQEKAVVEKLFELPDRRITHLISAATNAVLAAWETTDMDREGITVFELSSDGELQSAAEFEIDQLHAASDHFRRTVLETTHG